jgi:hypothetical protein
VTENTDKVQTPDPSKNQQDNSDTEEKSSRMPSDSVLFEKIVPAALFVMGVVTAALILFAFAVIVGLITF